MVDAASPRKPYVNTDLPPPQHPPLTKLSDYTFLVWKQACDGDDDCITGLKYVIHDTVVEDRTLAVIDSALAAVNLQNTPWPGVTFSSDTQPGTALIGSPNGWGVAYMLFTFPLDFGGYTIDEVVVFENDWGSADLALHIAELSNLPPWWYAQPPDVVGTEDEPPS